MSMRVIKPPIELVVEHGGYTAVPNEVSNHPYWEASKADAAFRALVKLYQVGGYSFPSLRKVAEQTGYNYNTWRHHLRSWLESGLVRKDGLDLELYPFADGSDIPEWEESQDSTELVEEAVAMPKTTVRIPSGEREATILQLWNENVPEDFKQEKRVPLAVKMAIDLVMKKLGIESGDYEKFMLPVIRAAKEIKTNRERNAGLSWVFGWHQDTKPLVDWKMELIIENYSKGLKVQVIRSMDSVTWGSDEEVLSLLPEQTYRGVKFERVDRIRIDEIQETPLFAALNYLQFGQWSAEQARVKAAQAGVEWRDIWAEPGTLVMFYKKDQSKIPFGWNLHESPREILNKQ